MPNANRRRRTLAGMDLEVCHPVELLDAAYERAGMYGEQ